MTGALPILRRMLPILVRMAPDLVNLYNASSVQGLGAALVTQFGLDSAISRKRVGAGNRDMCPSVNAIAGQARPVLGGLACSLISRGDDISV
jgi:hypothetical protein